MGFIIDITETLSIELRRESFVIATDVGPHAESAEFLYTQIEDLEDALKRAKEETPTSDRGHVRKGDQ